MREVTGGQQKQSDARDGGSVQAAVCRRQCAGGSVQAAVCRRQCAGG